jgi:hypothetical protein
MIVLSLLLPYSSSKDMGNIATKQSKIISNLALMASIAGNHDSSLRKRNHSSRFLAMKLLHAEKVLLY